MNSVAQRKADEEKAALQIAEATEKDGLYRLMKAVAKSERLVAEDIMREAGYMLPQSNNAHELLEELIAKSPDGFPVETAKKLLKMNMLSLEQIAEAINLPIEQVKKLAEEIHKD